MNPVTQRLLRDLDGLITDSTIDLFELKSNALFFSDVLVSLSPTGNGVDLRLEVGEAYVNIGIDYLHEVYSFDIDYVRLNYEGIVGILENIVTGYTCVERRSDSITAIVQLDERGQERKRDKIISLSSFTGKPTLRIRPPVTLRAQSPSQSVTA